MVNGMDDGYSTIEKIGFIGLGVMGGPMCRNLIRRAPWAKIVAFDRDEAAMDSIRALGAETASSAAQLIKGVDILLLSLPDGKAVESVFGLIEEHLRPGQIVVDTSTTPVDLTRELAARARSAGADFVDAPIARTRQAAESGTLSIMVGGSEAAFGRLRSVLECMGSDISYCGAVGAGQIVKILNNMVLFQTVHALSEAMAIATRAGVDGHVLFDAFTKGSADSFALRNHGMKAILPGEFPLRAFSTAYARKDNTYALALAEATGITARGAKLLEEVFARAQAHGLTDSYFPVFHNLHDMG
jgi:3-hydroxyisobutyrate dehydrogenase-like beta-hydroxyacid dehydrogenase